MKDYRNKLVLITGASSGIGLSFAHHLAREGANLILVARTRIRLEEIASELKKIRSDIQIHVIDMDLGKPLAAKALFEQTQKLNLSVDILINNAGFGKWGEFLDFDRDTYHSMLTLNINTLTDLCHVYLPAMLIKKEGGIINVASTASFQPVPYAAVYSASKSYVLNFSEALYGEYVDQGVVTLALCPGGTETNFNAVADSSVVLPSGSLESPDVVARRGLDAFLEKRNYIVSGNTNYLTSLISRLLSRKSAIFLTRKVWKKVIDNKKLA